MTETPEGVVVTRAVSEDAIAHLAIRSPLNRAIYGAVRGYRMSNMCDADDSSCAYPLVDLMSNPAPADIGTGEMEMVALVDEIEAAVRAHTPTLRGEEMERLLRICYNDGPQRVYSEYAAKTLGLPVGELVPYDTFIANGGRTPEAERVIRCVLAALSQPLAVDTGQSVPAGWIGWSGGAVPVQGTDARGLILFKGEAVEQAEARGEAILDYWPWYGEDEQPLAVAYKLATPAPSVSPDPAGEVQKAWQRISDALDGIEGGMHAELEDAASAMWPLIDALASSPIPKTLPREAVERLARGITELTVTPISEHCAGAHNGKHLLIAKAKARAIAALLQEDRQS